MTDLQIDYFMAVATNLSFTKTSEELFVSQPAISRQISQLEKELGAKLFVRSNYSIRLTEAGMLLRERAEDILALVDKTLADFQSLEDSFRGEIYVGAPESESMLFFAEAVRDLQKEHPGIRCNIYSGNMEDVCEKLVEFAYASDARMAIIPMQDLLRMDSRSRMNVPGTVGMNWKWCLQPGYSSAFDAQKLRALCQKYGRCAE